MQILSADILNLAGDTIVVCTTAQPVELEKSVDCDWLCSDGVIEIKPSQLSIFSCISPIPQDFNCLEIVWD